MNFSNTKEFKKDFKKFLKKFRSLSGDLKEFKKILNKSPLGIGKHFNVITKIDSVCIVKARFFCRSLRKKNLRIIYAYNQKNKIIEFIEIYFKGDKPREDQSRIRDYIN